MKSGEWKVYHNIDMCFQGDVEIIGDWKCKTSIEQLKRTVEDKGYSAVCVGSFGHAALKKFDYQLTKDHCKPSSGYTNTLYIWFPSNEKKKNSLLKKSVQSEAVDAGLGFFLLHDADFKGRDDRASHEGCASLEQAAKLIAAKAHSPSTCYAWRGKEALVTIPAVGAAEMGNGAKWSTGAELIVCGRDTGHRSNGKLLIALENVDCCFGDGNVFGGIGSYDQALCAVIDKNNTKQTAYFWHSPSSRLIEKPKDRGSNWCGYPGYGWLFLWADARVEGLGGGGGGGAPQPSSTSGTARLSLGSTPSHGNPPSTSALNTELNNVARNTDDTAKARALVAAGADLSSTNGGSWRHTPLHQAAYHGRFEMAKVLVELGSRLDLHSNPCGRGSYGTPLELARGGGHHRIAKMLEVAEMGAANGGGGKEKAVRVPDQGGANGALADGVCAFTRVDSHAFDRSGVLYAIGTDFGRAPYTNPADSAKVSLEWSSDGANFYSTNGGHKMGDARQASHVICANAHPGANATQWSGGAPGAWFALDLKGVALCPTGFAYRNDYGGGGNHPRNFELQGSGDFGRTWTTLSKHENENWSGHCAKYWVTQYSGRESFTRFRILNQGAPNHLCCSGIELYGRITAGAPLGGTGASCSSSPPPVVVGQIVKDSREGLAANEASGDGGHTLIEMVDMLKRELGVSGNVNEVVHAAAEAVGVKTSGKALLELAREVSAVVAGWQS